LASRTSASMDFVVLVPKAQHEQQLSFVNVDVWQKIDNQIFNKQLELYFVLEVCTRLQCTRHRFFGSQIGCDWRDGGKMATQLTHREICFGDHKYQILFHFE